MTSRHADHGVLEAGRKRCVGFRNCAGSFYKWRAKFGGMDASLIAEMKDMAEQNRRLKKMYAEMSMQNDLLKEALGKKR